ncbi:MAG: sulfite reductase subunit alpha [Planctomycetota bacterium]
MTTLTLPPDAPFAPDQRPFVEGFLSALTTVRMAQRSAADDADRPGAPLTVLYGSQSGNCEGLSKALRKQGRKQGFKPEVEALDAFDFDRLAEVEHLLIVCSTFGEGDPPDNAMRFTERLMRDDAPRLENLSYGVCAMGDRSYTHFCKAGRDLDVRLAELGATRLVECVECDVDYDEDWAGWTEAVFAHESMAAAVEAAGGAPSAGVDEDDEPSVGPASWSKANPYPATVLRVQTLNAQGSAKEVNHVEISLAGSGLEYEVGDALGLWPVNCGDAVDALLEAGGYTGEEMVTLKGVETPLRAALLTRLDLHVLTQPVAELFGLDVDADWLRGRHVIDVLAGAETPPDAAALAGALRPIQPRLYSIASSPKAHPGQVHLTVGAVRYELHGLGRKGVASTFLADRCGPGASVGVYVHKSPHFRLPEDGATPIVMVGPGTGVAPFRAFLEERIATEAAGPSWVFFGDQHEATDFLYGDWLREADASGALTRLDLAWSRDGDEKVYVQHRMLEQGAELFRWLEDGAHFYVCGDASRMAHDVDTALHTIAETHGGMSAEAAGAYVQALADAGRYQRDVY